MSFEAHLRQHQRRRDLERRLARPTLARLLRDLADGGIVGESRNGAPDGGDRPMHLTESEEQSDG